MLHNGHESVAEPFKSSSELLPTRPIPIGEAIVVIAGHC
jgi:hypothetical protein